MSNTNEFQWNDELAGEFAYWYKNLSMPVKDPVNEFKQSKSTPDKIEVEIITGGCSVPAGGTETFYVITSQKIPPEKYEAIKKSIEAVLNPSDYTKDFIQMLESGKLIR